MFYGDTTYLLKHDTYPLLYPSCSLGEGILTQSVSQLWTFSFNGRWYQILIHFRNVCCSQFSFNYNELICNPSILTVFWLHENFYYNTKIARLEIILILILVICINARLWLPPALSAPPAIFNRLYEVLCVCACVSLCVVNTTETLQAASHLPETVQSALKEAIGEAQ